MIGRRVIRRPDRQQGDNIDQRIQLAVKEAVAAFVSPEMEERLLEQEAKMTAVISVLGNLRAVVSVAATQDNTMKNRFEELLSDMQQVLEAFGYSHIGQQDDSEVHSLEGDFAQGMASSLMERATESQIRSLFESYGMPALEIEEILNITERMRSTNVETDPVEEASMDAADDDEIISRAVTRERQSRRSLQRLTGPPPDAQTLNNEERVLREATAIRRRRRRNT